VVVAPGKYAIAATGGVIEFRSGILDVDSLVPEFPSLLRRILDLPLDRLAITCRYSCPAPMSPVSTNASCPPRRNAYASACAATAVSARW